MKNKILKKVRKGIDSLDGEKSLGSLQDIDSRIEKANILLGKVESSLKEIANDKDKVKKVKVINPSEIDKKIEVKNLSEIKFPTELKINNFPKQKTQKEIKVNNLGDIKLPSKFEITNFPKQKEVNIPEFPKEIKVKKPSWYQAITENSLLVLLQSIANYTLAKLSKMTFKSDLDEYKKKDNSLAVHLVDEKGNEYTAMSNLIGGGGGLNQKETTEAINNSNVSINLENVIETDDNTIRTEGYYPLIAQKKIEGRSAWSKVGKILNPSDTNFEIISNIAVIHPGGIQCEVVSTSADDTIAGTGTQKILLAFYDSSWVYQTEVVEMNGLTPVNTVSIDINRMECMSVYQSGSGIVSAGAITLKDTGAVNTYFQIDAKENFCPRCLHYIVPGTKSYVTDILVSSNTKEGVEFRLVITVDNGANGGTGGKVLIGRYATKILDDLISIHFNIPIEMDASNSTVGMGLFLAVKGEAANQEAFGSIVGYDEVT